ncbi:MAG TPA: ABC transporter permease, partial [Gemmatimonadaceae bacterium]|nr:ABC transporter permease [Gemmatimonadaceae bacterium]
MFRTESLRVGIETLRANPLRSILSTLGVIMGVGSMVAVLAMGDGVERYARDQVARTTDLQAVAISPTLVQRIDGIFVRRTDIVQFDLADLDSLQVAVPEAAAVDLTVAGGTIAQLDSTSRGRGVQVRAVASTQPADTQLAARGLKIASGRIFTSNEVRARAPVTVLRASTADT